MSPEAVTDSAERRLGRLLERLLVSGEAAAVARNWDQAREAAEDVLTVDPGNARAQALVEQATAAAQLSTGERSLMTVMFSDLVDSTPMAEGSPPEVIRDIFGLYRERSQAAIERFGGSILQFLGDGIVAAFGYPQPYEDNARRAVHAGLELLRSMTEARILARDRHGLDVQVRAGIHTGLVVVGDLGEGPSRERHSIVGVTPNLAARLQAEAKPGMVVVSDVTHHLVATDFDFESLGVRELRGISRPVEVYAVVGPRHGGSRLASERYQGQIVGRDDELARLSDAWGRASQSPVPAFTIVGDPGMGKSRLVAALLARATEEEAVSVDMECLPYYADTPFYPVQRGLEVLMGVEPTDTDEVRLQHVVDAVNDAALDPATAVPLIAPLIDLNSTPGYSAPELDPIALRQATIATVVDYVSRLAGDQPLLLVAEDIDTADPSTLELLGQIVLSSVPGLLTVMTSRRAVEASWFDETEMIQLEGLSAQNAEELIHSLVGPDQLSEHAVESIIDRAEGIPLFIEELVYSVLTSPERADVPLRLQELLTARLHSPGVDLRTAQIAATAGVVFDAATVATVAHPENAQGHGAHVSTAPPDGRPDGRPPAVPPLVAGLVDAGIVVPEGDVAQGRYRFYHPLLRDAAYETQVLDTRRETHAKLAEALAAVDAEPGVIARHLDLGGAAAEAVGQYITAAQLAQSQGAHVEAASLTSRALELILDWPPEPQRHLTELTARLIRSLSYSSVRGYAAPEVVDDFEEAERLTESIGEAPEIMPAMIAIWSYRLVHGEVEAAAALIERLLNMTPTETGAWFAAEVEASAGFQALFQGELAIAAQHLERAFDAFDDRPREALVSEFWPLPNDPLAVSQIAFACVLALRGDRAGSAEWEERALSRAREVPFPRGPFSLAFVNIYLAWLRYTLGDVERAQHAGLEVIQIGQQHGYAYWLALGAVFYRVAQPDREEYEQTLATLGAIGHRAFLPAYLGIKAAIEQELEPETSRATLEEALAIAEGVGERLHTPCLLLQRAGLHLGEDRAADAAADLVAAASIAESQQSRLIALRAAIEVARLPTEVRPSDWRDILTRQIEALDEANGVPELDEAADLLV